MGQCRTVTSGKHRFAEGDILFGRIRPWFHQGGITFLLETDGSEALAVWLGQLLRSGLVLSTGQTSGKRYFVAPAWLRGAQLDRQTTLVRVAPHRLRALILEDLERYPDSSSSDVNRRIGAEVSVKTVKRALDELVAAGSVRLVGERRWRRYRVVGSPA